MQRMPISRVTREPLMKLWVKVPSSQSPGTIIDIFKLVGNVYPYEVAHTENLWS